MRPLNEASRLAIMRAQPEKARFEPLPVPSKHRMQWTKVKSNFLYTAPAFSHILYTMLVPDTDGEHCATFTDEIPVAATDGAAVYLHPVTYFEDYTLHEQVFILGHEVCHAFLNHPILCHMYRKNGGIKYPDGEFLPYDHELMGKTLDYVINALLVEDGIGRLPKDGLFDLSIATANDHHTEVYRKLFRQTRKPPRPGRTCPNGPAPGGNGQKSFDEILEPGEGQGKSPEKAAQERNEHEWKAALAAGLASAKAQGKNPGALERVIGEIMEPTIAWNEHIEMFFARKAGTAGYDWRRPDRRWITRESPVFVPSTSGFGADTIVVAGDTSGSITDKILKLFFGELAGILEDVRPRRLVVIWCDAMVQRVDEVEEASDLVTLLGKKIPGGGGTDFRPVFKKIQEMGLDDVNALIYLTDGLGTFPREAPKYPVLWGSTYCEEKHYPFGEVVMLPKI